MELHITKLEEKIHHLGKTVKKFGIEKFSNFIFSVYNDLEPTASNN
jgi:dissimilatory sulfite reductase (desulfoviridin) alpha/beta subunit